MIENSRKPIPQERGGAGGLAAMQEIEGKAVKECRTLENPQGCGTQIRPSTLRVCHPPVVTLGRTLQLTIKNRTKHGPPALPNPARHRLPKYQQ
jgi:hypothetical protein